MTVCKRPYADPPTRRNVSPPSDAKPSLNRCRTHGLCYIAPSAVIELSTYVFEALREDGELVLYRGRRKDDGSRLLAEEPVSERPSVRSLEQLEHEYSIREELDPDWAAQPIALERRDGRTILLLEDPGGEPLGNFLAKPLELMDFLRLAIALAGALRKLHAAGLIHKNIKPANILAEAATGKVWLTGFGVASRLRRERQAPEGLESFSTLAYISPEQTGRMNRSIDSRSDLYSYGATLYEMLTGALPFTVSEPIEWVHAHIARRPIPPSERVEQIPETISAIVMKLLAKASEERYQTAAGVEADFRRCLGEIVSLSRIDPFPLGVHDVSDRLLIPERLYGRDKESEALRDAFARVASIGRPEVVLVSGYSGIGKSWRVPGQRGHSCSPGDVDAGFNPPDRCHRIYDCAETSLDHRYMQPRGRRPSL